MIRLEPGHISPEEVRQRFRSAARRGQPAWLWPEIPVEQWRNALHRIETVIRAALAGESAGRTLDGNPEAVGLACYTSGVGPLLGWWREHHAIEASPAVGAILDLHLSHNRQRSARLQEAATSVVEALHRRGVTPAVLKGAHTAFVYFPDPATRPASDIDLLIDPAATVDAEAAMRAAGYVAAGRGQHESSWRLEGAPEQPKSLRLVHGDDPWTVDLHSSLNVRVSPGAPVAELDVAAPLSTGQAWTLSPNALTLRQPLLLLHLAAHAGAGLHNLTLLRLVEIHFVVRRDVASGLLSWDELVEMGRRTGSLGFAWPSLKLCEDLAPGTVPESVLSECARSVPPAVRRVLDRLRPASAQRVDRTSITEHFMWANGISGLLRQAAFDIAPSRAWAELWPLYRRRMWQLLRGRLSR